MDSSTFSPTNRRYANLMNKFADIELQSKGNLRLVGDFVVFLYYIINQQNKKALIKNIFRGIRFYCGPERIRRVARRHSPPSLSVKERGRNSGKDSFRILDLFIVPITKVDSRRFELLTSSLQMRRSTN